MNPKIENYESTNRKLYKIVLILHNNKYILLLSMHLAILHKTNNYVDHNQINIRQQIENILDDPNILQFKKFDDQESMYTLIYHALKNNIQENSNDLNEKKLCITACNIWENRDTLYAGYFIDPVELDVNPDDKIDLNLFGSQISSQRVTGTLVIVKSTLTYDIIDNNLKTNSSPSNLTHYELLNIIENIYVKTGIILDTDGTIKTYNYIVNPMEHLILTDADYANHYVYHEYEVYTHIIIVIVDVRKKNDKLNDNATMLCGYPVKGTVFVGLYRKPDYNENPPYVDLSVDRFNNILCIRQKSTSLTTNMEKSDKDYVNFDKLLELEKDKHDNKPNKTPSDITGKLLNSFDVVNNPQ